MEASELRIGNWVQINNEYWPNLKGVNFKVTSIECSAFTLYSIKGVGNSNYNQYDYNIEPIPLTEDWLLKFGFEDVPTGNYWNQKLCIHIYSNEFYILQEQGRVFIQYVHQLQNLYFALTGEELTYGGGKQ